MEHIFLSALATDNFLPGILILNQSLINVKSKFKLKVITVPSLSKEVFEILEEVGIETIMVEPIRNPMQPKQVRFKHSYTKLRMFDLVQFDKIVFLDADTLVCNPIDDLFNKPHMSAVNTGGMLPEFSDWQHLNSGVMVLEPNTLLFEDFMRKKNILPSVDGGDQGFLQSYFSEWPSQEWLKLCHGYNLCVEHIPRYKELFGYDFTTNSNKVDQKLIRIIHFWGSSKPWLFSETEINLIENRDMKHAFKLWFETADQVTRTFSESTIKKMCKVFPTLNSYVSALT